MKKKTPEKILFLWHVEGVVIVLLGRGRNSLRNRRFLKSARNYFLEVEIRSWEIGGTVWRECLQRDVNSFVEVENKKISIEFHFIAFLSIGLFSNSLKDSGSLEQKWKKVRPGQIKLPCYLGGVCFREGLLYHF